MTNPKSEQFDLLSNARDSLAHAVSHISDPEDKPIRKWKIAIREVSHVVELLLKERLRREHPALIWERVDDFACMDARTVGAETAALRLNKICGILLPKGTRETLYVCRQLRNRIEHCEFQLNKDEARGIVGRLLSFIFDFSKTYLQLDLEEEFRKDHTWDALIEIYEFRQAQSVIIQKKFSEEEIPSETCPSCGEDTFNLDEDTCALCGHHEQHIECDYCHRDYFESEIDIFPSEECADDTYICKKCLNDLARADELCDAMREERGL